MQRIPAYLFAVTAMATALTAVAAPTGDNTYSGSASNGMSSGSAPSSWLPMTSYGYVGISGGRSRFEQNCSNGYACETRDTGYKIFTGGQISQGFGAEVSLVDLGSVNRNGGQTDAQLVNFGLLGKVPLGPVSLYGKIGALYGHTKISASAPGASTGSTDRAGWSYGVGMQADVARNWALRLDADRYRLKFVDADRDVNFYTASVVYKF